MRNFDYRLDYLDSVVSELSRGFGKEEKNAEEILGSIAYQMLMKQNNVPTPVGLNVQGDLEALCKIAKHAISPVSFLKAFDSAYPIFSKALCLRSDGQVFDRVLESLKGPMVSNRYFSFPACEVINLSTYELMGSLLKGYAPTRHVKDSRTRRGTSMSFAHRSEGQQAKLKEIAADPSNNDWVGSLEQRI